MTSHPRLDDDCKFWNCPGSPLQLAKSTQKARFPCRLQSFFSTPSEPTCPRSAKLATKLPAGLPPSPPPVQAPSRQTTQLFPKLPPSLPPASPATTSSCHVRPNGCARRHCCCCCSKRLPSFFRNPSRHCCCCCCSKQLPSFFRNPSPFQGSFDDLPQQPSRHCRGKASFSSPLSSSLCRNSFYCHPQSF